MVHSEALNRDRIKIAEELLVNNRTGPIQTLVELPIEPNNPALFLFGARLANHSRWLPRGVPRNARDCGGAGLTRTEGKAAAIGESIERYCASIYFKENLLFGSYEELKPEYPLADPKRFSLFHPAQYAQLPYSPFTSETPLAWACGRSLVTGKPIFIPACLVYMGYQPQPEAGDHMLAPSLSTGCACALSFKKALLSGLYEVLERDAFTITWLNQLPPAEVNIASHPALDKDFSEKLAGRKLEYRLFRLPSDLGVYTFLSLLIDHREDPPLITAGGAANLDPVRAARKALIESAHTRSWARVLMRDKPNRVFRQDFRDVLSFDDHTLLYAREDMREAVAFLLEPRPKLSFNDLPNGSAGKTESDLRQTLTILSRAGMEPAALDVTTPEMSDIGFRVARVLVPRLQPLNGPYSQRFLGGERLYSVPQALGYAEREPGPGEFNPYPHPYP